MAKKKEDLTKDELLEQVLVPESEWLYQVPENWVWVYLIDGFADCLDKFRKPVNSAERDDRDGDVPYYGATSQVGWIDDYLTDENLLLIGEDGAPFFDYLKDKAYIIEGKAWVNNHAHIVKSKFGIMGNKFLMHYINIFDFHGFVSGTTRLKLTQESMKNIPVVLPPLTEQQRIVDRIESLFEKLDQAKGLTQDALDSFENRKAAILHKAFSGELTKKWREENGIGMESWENTRIYNVCFINPSKVDTKCIEDNMQVSFIPMSAVSDVYGRIESPQVRSLIEVKKGYTNFMKGDVIFAKITPCMENGKIAIVGSLMNGVGFGSTEFHVFRCKKRLLNQYLYHVLRNQSFRDEAKSVMTGAVGQQRVPKSFLEDFTLLLPKVDEQKEIVRIINETLEKEHNAFELYDSIENIDLMKKSILARAFRGELGTNDLEEESAINLLIKVLTDDTKETDSKKERLKPISMPDIVVAALSSTIETEQAQQQSVFAMGSGTVNKSAT